MRWMVALIVLCAGCSTKQEAAPQPQEAPPAAPHEAPHWGYTGEHDPGHWAEMDPSFKSCGAGTQQTPIDLPSKAVPGLLHGVEFQYKPSALNLINNGHTVQANYDTGSRLQWNGQSYELAQFHFHAHSEHSVAGKTYPLELHLVHKNAEGKLAVAAVFIDAGDENRALSAVFANLPKREGEATAVQGGTVDASQILPQHRWAYHYTGSLTTPPCTEGVEWVVFSEPVQASPTQIQAYTALYANDYRPTQATNGRTIEGAHFTYEGEEGPSHWGEQSPAWTLCESGKEQSPIDIPATIKPSVPQDLTIAYKPAPLRILNNGHTVEVEYESGSTIQLGATPYSLAQFHFHAHSEHAIAGKTYPLELHLVHKSQEGALAVIAVLIQEGAANAALEPVFSHMPTSAGPASEVAGSTIDAAKLLPASLRMWRYDGSLTTPPCSEHVKWHVLTTPVSASAEQIAHFTALYKDDARPIQPLGARTFVSAGPAAKGGQTAALGKVK